MTFQEILVIQAISIIVIKILFRQTIIRRKKINTIMNIKTTIMIKITIIMISKTISKMVDNSIIIITTAKKYKNSTNQLKMKTIIINNNSQTIKV
jgi:hypothetical protein